MQPGRRPPVGRVYEPGQMGRRNRRSDILVKLRLRDEDRLQLADFETRTRFPVCELIDQLHTDWQDDHWLPVQLDT
jgi:hypothetical protein